MVSTLALGCTDTLDAQSRRDNEANPQVAFLRGYHKAINTFLAKKSELAAEPSTTVAKAIESQVVALSRYWLGTTWALGAPQTKSPQTGKINCGTFVGRLLADAGFVVNVQKLQRQPSQKIIESFVRSSRTKKFSNTPMDKFLEEVREMGPGLFIVGLDFHVGFLHQTKTDLRFIHASYITKTVVDEPAKTAVPITTSGYRVVGKILSPGNVGDWKRGRRIKVKGKW